MLSKFDGFFQLDRSFHELANKAGAGDDVDLSRHFGRPDALHWGDLLKEHRVILLSEAGSGKTVEIRNTARRLRAEGKPAFFIRIEHVVQNFEDAFEEGDLAEFDNWIASGKEGWLLLDSVDEARLRAPSDFELAINKIGRKLSSAMQTVHVILTGRTTAWRPKTDLLLCRRLFPFIPAQEVVDQEASPDAKSVARSWKRDDVDENRGPFKVVALDDLHGNQVDTFLKGLGVENIRQFLDAAEKKEAMHLAARPQDLAELAEFWLQHQRIGSRIELMKDSIARRLAERDENRVQMRSLAADRLLTGAWLLAAATTLGKQSGIRVPDGTENSKGISVREVLTDWNDIDCSILLTRPIFDEGIYGTVRFHHRSVREFLTAEWLHSLLVKAGFRAKVEALFFRRQYGMEVIVPTMRPVLPWLAILDQRILERTLRIAPEVIFEGGDPSQLPLEMRGNILRQVCAQMAQPAHGRSPNDLSAVQRFATPDLAGDIKALLSEYGENDEVASFLLRMVWRAEIAACAPDAKRFALASRARYTRITAFRALASVGSPADQAEVRQAFLAKAGDVSRDWLAELLEAVPDTFEGMSWLLKAIGRTPAKERFSVDQLAESLGQKTASLPIALIPEFVTGMREFLQMPPTIDAGHCRISKHFSWLAQHAAQAILRLIRARDPKVLLEPSLAILCNLPSMADYSDHELRDIRADMIKAIGEFPALNQALFWHAVGETRARYDALKGERLTDYWPVGSLRAYWSFKSDSFNAICDDVVSRPLVDDRLVALTLAFAIYRENGRPAAMLERLHSAASSNVETLATLGTLLGPPPAKQIKWQQEEAKWKRKRAQEVARQENNRRDWNEHLIANIEALRIPGTTGDVTNEQLYLHERLREGQSHSGKWSEANWRFLIPECGELMAHAFRDGAIAFWRRYRPQLRSEGAPHNTTPFNVIFGLTGLSIEARETDGWPARISAQEADVATRYALLELNGFPAWLPSLFVCHPDVVLNVVMTEIDHELTKDVAEPGSTYVLYDVSWDGAWMWDRIAPSLVTRLQVLVKSFGNLRYMIGIIQGSSIADQQIATLSHARALAAKDLATASIWYAAWVGTEPDLAIPQLSAYLASIETDTDKILFAMQFITALIGDRRESRNTRQAYRTVAHMKSLYLMMHAYVREQDDLHRANKGVYSPELRDNAQEARNALFAFIRETPGKEAFLALTEISELHPVDASRPWIAWHASEKATADADIAAWSPADTRAFHDQLERVPSNHRDLWYLAVDRLVDLKNDLEQGDSSIASLLLTAAGETEIRKFIGGWCRDHAVARYSIPPEEELADAKRPDLRFHGSGFDGPIPVELKLADNWTGPQLFERLEAQLCGDYLRDARSSRGIFLLVHRGKKQAWELPDGRRADSFDALIEALEQQWDRLAQKFQGVEDIAVIGIDLTKRQVAGKALAVR